MTFASYITCIFPKRGGWKKLKKIWSVYIIREKRDKLFYIRGGRRKIIFEFFKKSLSLYPTKNISVSRLCLLLEEETSAYIYNEPGIWLSRSIYRYYNILYGRPCVYVKSIFVYNLLLLLEKFIILGLRELQVRTSLSIHILPPRVFFKKSPTLLFSFSPAVTANIWIKKKENCTAPVLSSFSGYNSSHQHSHSSSSSSFPMVDVSSNIT